MATTTRDRKSTKTIEAIDTEALAEYSTDNYHEKLYETVYYTIRELQGLSAKRSVGESFSREQLKVRFETVFGKVEERRFSLEQLLEYANRKFGKSLEQLLEINDLKSEFHCLFENSENLGQGTFELIDWLKKAEAYYKKSVTTIKRWLAEIVGDFEQKTTKAIVEGINNQLKLLKRSGFGFSHFNNFELRARLFWHFPKKLAY